MPLNTQLGVKAEVTYGTPVVVDQFFEFENESITPMVETIAPQVMRTTTRTVRYDRFVRGINGHTGSVSLPVMTKEFGFWLVQLVGGSVTTPGGPTDSTYTHTADIGSLCGKGFTLQVNRPRGICGDTNQAFTYAGGKVLDWTISCETGGVVMLEANCFFQSMLMTTALASASYAAGMEFLPWGASSITVGGLSLPVSNWSVSCDNGFQERPRINNSYAYGEPVEGMREITFEATCDLEAYVDGTPSGKVGFLQKILTTGGLAATVADSYEAVVITSNGPTLAGTTTYPSLVITMSACRIDEAFGNIDGPDMTEITVRGTAMVPSSGSTLGLAYTTTDATA